MSREGKKFLVELEGVCLTPYFDSVGVVTIGVGATRSEIPKLAKWPKTKSITMEVAFKLLNKSLIKYENAVDKALTVKISQEKFDSLVSICYNIGIGGMKRSTFIKRINRGESPVRIKHAMMMWRKPKEIIGRRTREADLFMYEKYRLRGTAQLFVTSNKGSILWSKTKSIKLDDYIA